MEGSSHSKRNYKEKTHLITSTTFFKILVEFFSNTVAELLYKSYTPFNYTLKTLIWDKFLNEIFKLFPLHF